MSIEFEVKASKVIDGVYSFQPTVSKDIRGTIWTSFLRDDVEKYLPDDIFFKHDKFSESKYNVLRGIHGDSKSWKLVTSVYGEVHQVVVDLRESSPTYMK